MANKILAGVFLYFLLWAQVNAQVDLDKINAYLEKVQQEWNVPSMTVGIVKDGELIFSKGYGTLEAGKALAPDGNSLYAVASNSKAFTSFAIALLVQEGKLNWDDRVVDHLPNFKMYDEYVTQHLTIRDLLSHRCGLGTFSGDIIWYRSTLTSEEIVKRIRHLQPAFEFRDGYGYSNVMYVTAGEVIKEVSGLEWSEFIKQNILDPLEMDRTVASITQLEGMENVASPHALIEGENVPIAWTNWDAVAATGGLISSVEDMAKWVIFNLNHGVLIEDTLLSPASRNLLWKPHNNFLVSHTDEDYATHFRSYGLGWGLSDYHGRLRVGHTGGYDGMITLVQLIPDEGLGVIVLTNGMKSPIRAVANYIIDAYLKVPTKDWSTDMLEKYQDWQEKDTRIQDRIDARVMKTKPSQDLDQYVGEYYADIYGTISISKEGKDLKMVFEHSPDFTATLTHWHYNVFKINWQSDMPWFTFGTVKFNLDNNLKIKGLSFDVPNDDIWFYELEPKRVEN